MTERAKWAFETKKDALAFIDQHGGELTTFEVAMRETYVDMNEDIRRLARMKEEYARTKHRLSPDF